MIKRDENKTQVRTIYLVTEKKNKYTFVVTKSFCYKNNLTSRSADDFHFLSLYATSLKTMFRDRTKWFLYIIVHVYDAVHELFSLTVYVFKITFTSNYNCCLSKLWYVNRISKFESIWYEFWILEHLLTRTRYRYKHSHFQCTHNFYFLFNSLTQRNDQDEENEL